MIMPVVQPGVSSQQRSSPFPHPLRLQLLQSGHLADVLGLQEGVVVQSVWWFKVRGGLVPLRVNRVSGKVRTISCSAAPSILSDDSHTDPAGMVCLT
jgi:hypothetical protein